ncbi:MAG: DNA repair protein RecO [Mariprofundaceae bacterium]
MAEHKDRALLLRRIPFSDTSLICHFLTEQHGRITLMARGARRAKSPFRAALAPLYLLNISWRPGRTGMGTLVDIDRGERLLDENLSLDGLELCAVASGLFQEGDPHGYEELLQAMHVMQKTGDSALHGSIWHLLQSSGWVSDFVHCWHCGEPVDESLAMGWQACQLVCDSCGKGMPVSAGMRKGFTAQLIHSNVRLSQRDLSCWQRIIEDVLKQHGLKPLTTLNQEYS